jgi:hypothetical protein
MSCPYDGEDLFSRYLTTGVLATDTTQTYHSVFSKMIAPPVHISYYEIN